MYNYNPCRSNSLFNYLQSIHKITCLPLVNVCLLKDLVNTDIQRILQECSCFFLDFLKELGKRDKIPGLPSILSHFGNDFNKFNNTGARMLDSIYHNDLTST